MGKLLGDQAADQIIQLIIDNDGKAGDKMPNEYELAEQLNVSRSTVREAIKALVSRNILEIKRGSGTFISEEPPPRAEPERLGFRPASFSRWTTSSAELYFFPVLPKIW